VNSRRLLGAALFGLVLTFLLGFFAGQSRRLSIDLWLVITTVWLGRLVLEDVSQVAPVRPDRLRGIWRRQKKQRPVDSRPRELANLEGLLVNALHSDRATRIRLRPRLIVLSDHVLRTDHGIDRTVHPERAAEVLGRVAWLVDPDADVERTPTTVELEQLLAVLVSTEATKQGTTVNEP
jgi:hypothetical protein